MEEDPSFSDESFDLSEIESVPVVTVWFFFTTGPS